MNVKWHERALHRQVHWYIQEKQLFSIAAAWQSFCSTPEAHNSRQHYFGGQQHFTGSEVQFLRAEVRHLILKIILQTYTVNYFIRCEHYRPPPHYTLSIIIIYKVTAAALRHTTADSRPAALHREWRTIPEGKVRYPIIKEHVTVSL